MVDGKKDKKVQRKDKGISTDAFLSDTDADTKNSNKSLQKELQTVIDLMGPTSPHLSYNASSDADNEESVISSSTVQTISSSCFEQHISLPEQVRNTTAYATRKIIKEQITTTTTASDQQDNLSVIADIGTNQSDFGCQYSVNDSAATPLPYQPSIPCPCLRPSYVTCSNPKCLGHNHNPMLGYMHHTNVQVPSRNVLKTEQPSKILRTSKVIYGWLRNKTINRLPTANEAYDYYKMNMLRPNDEQMPTRLIFDLIDGIPRPEVVTVATNTQKLQYNNQIQQTNNNNCNKKQEIQKNLNRSTKDEIKIEKPKKIPQKNYYTKNNSCRSNTRVDFYYFDHGNTGYFRTTDCPPILLTEILAEKTENYTTKFWAEFFGTIHILFSFCTSFILQLFRFIMYGMFRPLIIGFIQLSGDYFLKPLLTTCFNGLIQPALIFFYNIATSLKDLCDPIAEGFGYFIREIAVLIRAIRLISINKKEACHCIEAGNFKNDNKCNRKSNNVRT